MPTRVKDSAHLILLVLVFVGGVALFLILRRAVVPPSFGVYGHYRAAALLDIRRHPVSFAGQGECAFCHDEVVTLRGKGKHRQVACEACHGPLKKHTDDPSAVKPKHMAGTGLCQRCHEADAAKPKQFPQVASVEHSGGSECLSCHQPHSPGL